MTHQPRQEVGEGHNEACKECHSPSGQCLTTHRALSQAQQPFIAQKAAGQMFYDSTLQMGEDSSERESDLSRVITELINDRAESRDP